MSTKLSYEELEAWWDAIEENGGPTVFEVDDTPEELLLEEEKYLDGRSPCRRGSHDWRLQLESEVAGEFEAICRRCDAQASVTIDIKTEGDYAQQDFHELLSEKLWTDHVFYPYWIEIEERAGMYVACLIKGTATGYKNGVEFSSPGETRDDAEYALIGRIETETLEGIEWREDE